MLMHNINDHTEPPLTEPQRTFIDCDNVPPITTFTEFLGCLETQRALKVREHYKQLSHHDQDEQRYLDIRIQNYKDTHESCDMVVLVFKLFEFWENGQEKIVIQSSNLDYVKEVMAHRKKKFKKRTYNIFTELVKTTR